MRQRRRRHGLGILPSRSAAVDFFHQAEQDAGDRVCTEAFAHLGWGEEALGRDGVAPKAMKARAAAIDAFGRYCATGWLKVKDLRPAEDQGMIEF